SRLTFFATVGFNHAFSANADALRPAIVTRATPWRFRSNYSCSETNRKNCCRPSCLGQQQQQQQQQQQEILEVLKEGIERGRLEERISYKDEGKDEGELPLVAKPFEFAGSSILILFSFKIYLQSVHVRGKGKVPTSLDIVQRYVQACPFTTTALTLYTSNRNSVNHIFCHQVIIF